MENSTIEEINEVYDIKIKKIVEVIKKQKAKRVLLQFPEGMKPFSTTICLDVEERARCQCFVWLDSCFGACDVPVDVERLGVDLIVQFGHSPWNFKKDVKVV